MAKLEQVFGFFFPADQLIALSVNFGILAIGLVALGLLASEGLLRLKRDVAALRQLDTVTARARSSDDIVSAAEALPADTAASQRVRDLAQLKDEGDDVNHEALAALAKVRLENSLTFARWASSTVVLLGLAGTLSGLTTAVTKAAPMLQGLRTTEFDDALDSVVGAFSGLHVAFATTLWGITWAVILSLGLSILRKRQVAFLSQLEQLTLVRLVPRFRTAAGIALVQAAKNLAELERRLDISLKTLINQVQTRGVALTSMVDKSFQVLTDEFSEKTGTLLDEYRSTSSQLAELLGAPANSPATLVSVLDSLQSTAAGVEDVAKRVGDLLPALESSVDRRLEQQTISFHTTLDANATMISSSVSRQALQLETLRESIQAFNSASANVVSAANEGTKVVSQHQQIVERMVQHFVATQEKFLDALIELPEKITAALPLLNKSPPPAELGERAVETTTSSGPEIAATEPKSNLFRKWFGRG